MKIDLHAHTHYSYCSVNKPAKLLKRAKTCGLDGIAITDHHTMKGAREVKRLNQDKEFKVILGEEITTEFGDILALFIEKEIKKRKLFEVIDEVKNQDGILIIPHPFRPVPWLKFRYPLKKLEKKVDAIEVFNGRNFGFANAKARSIAKNLDLAQTGGSDAHIPWDIGKGYTLFEGDLRKAIQKKKTQGQGTAILSLISGGTSFIAKRICTPLGLKKKWT